MLRNSMSGVYATQLIVGVVLGLLVAAGTILLAFNEATMTINVLAAVFAAWALGWILGPLFVGSERNDIRPEHLTLMPIGVKAMARGLLGASFVSIGSIVTLLAFLSLLVVGSRFGAAATLVAAVVVPASLALVILTSRVVIALLGETMRSRLGAALVAMPWAIMIACISNFGILLLILGQSNMLRGDWPAWLPIILRMFPSGWGIAAVEAAERSDWMMAGGVLLAFFVLFTCLLLVWSKLLSRRVNGALSIRIIRPRPSSRSLLKKFFSAKLAAVISKELRTWSRDMLRTYFWFFALWFALAYTLMPLFAGVRGYLPWTGVSLVVIAAAYAANLYSADGSALWTTLMTPGAERADVRGRQIAWLMVTVPMALLLTVIGIVIDGQPWTWPLVLGVLASSAGVGVGFLAFLSVRVPIQMPDAHHRSANPAADSGNLAGLVWAMIGMTLAGALPLVAVVGLGILWNNILLQWAALPLGLIIGSAGMWFFGRRAYRRLETNGPELLEKLRGGNPSFSKISSGKKVTSKPVLLDPPGAAQMRVKSGLCFGSGWIPIASGIISLILISRGGVSQTWWTLPTRLPEPLPGPVAVIFIGLGLFIYITGLKTALTLYRLRRGLQP